MTDVFYVYANRHNQEGALPDPGVMLQTGEQ